MLYGQRRSSCNIRNSVSSSYERHTDVTCQFDLSGWSGCSTYSVTVSMVHAASALAMPVLRRVSKSSMGKAKRIGRFAKRTGQRSI